RWRCVSLRNLWSRYNRRCSFSEHPAAKRAMNVFVRLLVILARVLVILACGAAGGVLFYFVSVLIFCTAGIGGNLCGLFGVFFFGPLGVILGFAAGFRLTRALGPP